MHYLDPDNSKNLKTCLALNIPDCIENDEQKCKICSPTKKLSEDGLSCVAKTKLLPNCIAYSFEEKCIRCSPPFFLDIELGICTLDQALGEYLDPNCAANSLNPTCNVCSPGYYFDSTGSCVECSAQNCLFCNRGGSACSMCMTGYYMTDDGICQLNKAVLFDSFVVEDVVVQSSQIWNLSLILIGFFISQWA